MDLLTFIGRGNGVGGGVGTDVGPVGSVGGGLPGVGEGAVTVWISSGGGGTQCVANSRSARDGEDGITVVDDGDGSS